MKEPKRPQKTRLFFFLFFFHLTVILIYPNFFETPLHFLYPHYYSTHSISSSLSQSHYSPPCPLPNHSQPLSLSNLFFYQLIFHFNLFLYFQINISFSKLISHYFYLFNLFLTVLDFLSFPLDLLVRFGEELQLVWVMST